MSATITESARDALTLNQAVDFVPGRPHVATIWRWATKGVRGHKLQTVIIGGRRMTTPVMIEEFLRQLNQGESITEEIDDADILRRSREAGATLEKLGC